MEDFINNLKKHALKKIRILLRNIKLTSTWQDYQKSEPDFNKNGCQQFQGRDLPKFPFLPFDNMIFIMFQAFQLYFCFNAIFHEHIIQILTITLLNFCWALYGTVQAVEVKIELGELSDFTNCVSKSNAVAPPDFWGNDIPCVIVLLMLAFIMSYLSYKLYKQFGWVATEHRSGMIIFLVLWIAVIVDFVFAMLLLVFGVKVLRNFGQGLKELINKNEAQEEPTPQNPGGLAHIWDDLEVEPGREKKWIIDE
ncbi:hypothetical protein C2G38_2186055 [Gigaspora rosea]|uniref:Uncharacterized protein n=1 Tax=Gigaspora rosea TaxID=44941 RepID=A0A397V657_9GLOM|nr:hypothetical protein C2G38_2186055 [Gigaspora rosea]